MPHMWTVGVAGGRQKSFASKQKFQRLYMLVAVEVSIAIGHSRLNWTWSSSRDSGQHLNARLSRMAWKSIRRGPLTLHRSYVLRQPVTGNQETPSPARTNP